jgi:competence protein ComER
MKIGLIGTGTMGGMLAHSFVQSAVRNADQVMLFNRTPEKAQAIAAHHHGMQVAASIKQLIEHCSIVFICVKPLEYKSVLDQLHGIVTEQHIVVTITSPVSIAQLETALPAKIAKLIPSITNSLQAGVALYCFGERITSDDRTHLLALFRGLGLPLEINERHTRIASDLSSCGPAFLSLLLEFWCQAAVIRTGLNASAARQMIGEMVSGLGRLLTCGDVTAREIITKVAVPGGITATGLECLSEQCADMFQKLTELTHQKFAEDCLHVEQSLQLPTTF